MGVTGVEDSSQVVGQNVEHDVVFRALARFVIQALFVIFEVRGFG